MKDYYKILELPFGAPSSAIKTAYRKLAFRYHPDKNQHDKIAEEKFIEITEAYNVLSDQDKIIQYHVQYAEFLKRQHDPVPEFQKAKVHPFYQDIVKDYPRTASGKASPRTIEWNIFNAGAIALFMLFIVYLLVYSMMQMKEQERMKSDRSIRFSKETLPPKEKYHITRDEYYEMVSQEFQESKDSTLLKIENIDSMMRVIDSLNILND